LSDKRDELRAQGVDVTDIIDHAFAKSIYFKDPNGLSLEYCCFMRNLTKDDATMQERFTVSRAALDLSSEAELAKERQVRHKPATLNTSRADNCGP
jgi:catechol-2,3-dioxygenase